MVWVIFFFFQYENPTITIDLKQNSSDKTPGDVDITDVAYYFEKDVSVMGEAFQRLNVYCIMFSSLTVCWLMQDKLLQCLDVYCQLN